MPTGPLNGIRIVDLTRVWAGPLATRILADLGADVIKVEAPAGRGPRVVPPQQSIGGGLDGAGGGRPWNRQGSFNKLSRNKRSLVLDLKTDEGRTLLLRLVETADIVIENFSVRAMPGLGLGYEQLREANESIIYVAMPGFGTTGPYRDYVAFGPSIEPMTGLTSIMGYSADQPRVTSVALPDAIGGTTAAAAVVTALKERTRTGKGQFVDLSQHEAGINMIGEYFIERQLSGRQLPPIGNGHAIHAPHGTYRCLGDDGWIVIAVRDDREWAALCEVAGRDWGDDPRFAGAGGRREHRGALDSAIEAWTVTRDKLELMMELQSAGVPAGAVLTAAELLDDPHLRERGFFAELDQPDVGPLPYPGTPVLLDGERASDWTPAPTLGQHNEEVLGGLLGVGEDELRALYERGVIADRPPA